MRPARSTGGQTTAGGLELLAIGLVTPLLDPVLADRFRVALLPDVGQQAAVVRRACQQLVQHVFDVDPDVEVVPPCAAHQGHHHRALLAPAHAADLISLVPPTGTKLKVQAWPRSAVPDDPVPESAGLAPFPTPFRPYSPPYPPVGWLDYVCLSLPELVRFLESPRRPAHRSSASMSSVLNPFSRHLFLAVAQSTPFLSRKRIALARHWRCFSTGATLFLRRTAAISNFALLVTA